MPGDETREDRATEGCDVDLDTVKAEIMEEVEALRKRRGGAAWTPVASPETISMQPTDEMMRIQGLDDASFLRAAYQIILDRPVDAVGYVDAMERLIDGESRSDVLWGLADSVEARSKGVDPSALLGDRPARSSAQGSPGRSFFRRLGSWALRLRHAPARIDTLGHDLRKVSLKVDWLLSQSAALESSRAETSSAIDRQVRALGSDLSERLARLQQAWEEVSEGLQRQLDIAADQYRKLVVSSEVSASASRSAIEDVRQLERRLLMDEYRLLDVGARTNDNWPKALPERDSVRCRPQP